MKNIIVKKPEKKFNPNQLTDEIADHFGLVRATETTEGNFFGMTISEEPSQIILHVADDVSLNRKEIKTVIEKHIPQLSSIEERLNILEQFLAEPEKMGNQKQALILLAKEMKARYKITLGQ